MNIQLNAKIISTGAEAIQHAKAVEAKRRLLFAGKLQPRKILHSPMPVSADAAPGILLQEWRRHDIHFDAHVLELRSFLGRPAAKYIARRAADFGLTYGDLVRKGRLVGDLCKARDIIAAELKASDRNMSWTELGRIFDRDHTSLFWGVHQVWADAGKEVSILKMKNRHARVDAAAQKLKVKRRGRKARAAK